MFDVNIYIETDGGGAKSRYRTYEAVIEFISKKSEPITRDVCGTEKATGNRIMLVALIASLDILTKPCRATVYMECPYVTENIRQGRMYDWFANGWKTIRSEPIKNRDEWEKIIRLVKMHELTFATARKHPYSDRLQYDIKKIKDKGMDCQQQAIGQ